MTTTIASMTRAVAALLLLLPGTAWTQAASAEGPAKPPVRICLVPASGQMATGNTEEAVSAVRDAFIKYLSGPSLSVTPLTARLASQAREEAKQGNCSCVLFASVLYKKKQGSGLLGQIAGDAAGSAVWHIPGGGTAASSAARTAATSAASSAIRMASYTKAKDELTLDYRLEALDRTAPLLTKTEKAKAKSDGQDLLTPLVEKAAEAIVAAAKK
jgi:hypothetical protein